MKRFLVPLSLAVLFSASGAARADLIFTTPLSGAGEIPATPSPALGVAVLDLSDDQTQIAFNIRFGLDAGSPPLTSPLAAGHIHFGPPGTNGPVILPFPNLPTGATSGTFSGVLTAANLTPAGGINTFADAVAALLAGNTYTNLHTTNFPGGEIRGQNSSAGGALSIPEPGTLSLFGLGAAGLVIAARRRRRTSPA
jgi:hypothetical protein